MYKWDTKKINQIINELTNKKPLNNDDLFEIEYCIKELKQMLNTTSKENFINEENTEYNDLEIYNEIICKIIENYDKENESIILSKQIKISKNEIIETTKNIIKNIDNKWFKLLEPIFNDKQILNFAKGNENLFYFFDYINKIYISLDKEDTIEDYLSAIHEYLHALTIKMNSNYLYNIENEFLSILGEFIMCYEMKKRNIHTIEFLKAEKKRYLNILSTIKETKLRILLINSGLTTKEKKYYLKNILNLNNKAINDIYSNSLTYNYSTIISYFIALELFETYKKNKKECIKMCESIISSRNDLTTTLNKNNITILKNDNTYIKKLKKEYATYNQ